LEHAAAGDLDVRLPVQAQPSTSCRVEALEARTLPATSPDESVNLKKYKHGRLV
jgi:hypothetical protein